MSEVGNIFGVLGSCMGCMVAVEAIAKAAPGAMNLMTLMTFTTIAMIGLCTTKKFFTVPNKIPFRGYSWVVTLFFIVNVVNNQALNFHVPVPLHIIFRSGSLLASLFLEVTWRGKSYSPRKYVSVAAITIGIIICTLATSSQDNDDLTYEQASKHYKEWIIGISMLVFALFASAFLAIKQQEMYQKYGKHPDEAMFVTHFYSLPFFLFMYTDIKKSYDVFNQRPELWATMIVVCVLQYLCIKFVYNLNANVEALTVTLVVTLRKFLSLLVSIWFYNNPFTPMHWVGTALVFGGTAIFEDVFFRKRKAD